MGIRMPSSKSLARKNKQRGSSRSKSKDKARSATNFMVRNRTLTPKGRRKNMPESGLHQEMVIDEKLQNMMDEKRE